MPRTARVVATGLPHHITQRGNRRAEIFLDDDDRERYLNLIRQYGEKHGVEVFGYCLMSNHVHLVAVPEESDSLARMILGAHMCYAQHFNWKYSQSGHLWQGRYFSCVLDERHTLAAARYVERNPVRAGLVGRAWDYRWSSARGHVGESKNTILSTRWPHAELLSQWREILLSAEEALELAEIRSCTRGGHPWGSAAFVEKLESIFGRSMVAGRRGRPPKKAKKKNQRK